MKHYGVTLMVVSASNAANANNNGNANNNTASNANYVAAINLCAKELADRHTRVGNENQRIRRVRPSAYAVNMWGDVS